MVRDDATRKETTIEETTAAGMASVSESFATSAQARGIRRSVTIRRVVFVVIVALICFSAIGGITLHRLFPDSFTEEPGLTGGTVSIDDAGLLSTAEIKANPVGALLSGAVGKKIEVQVIKRILVDIEEFTPLKNTMLVASASIQRLGIRTANIAFGYNVMPTFYGSGYIFMPAKQAVFSPLRKNSSEEALGFGQTVNEFCTLAQSNPDLRWFFYLEDISWSASCNPSASLMNDVMTYDDYYSALELSAPSETTLINGSYDNLDEFFEEYFRTDHHWNVTGAIKGFEKIAQAMQITIPDWNKIVYSSTDEFFGAAARSGLFLDYSDSGVADVPYDMSGIVSTIDGEQVDNTEINFLASNPSKQYAKQYETENLYASCFHTVYEEITLTNTNAESGTLLIVGNSFSSVIDRFFTASYHKVIEFDPRYCTTGRSIQDVIDAYSPDDVLFIWNCKSMRVEE